MHPGLGTGRDGSRDGGDNWSSVHHHHVIQPLFADVFWGQVGDVDGVDGTVHVIIPVAPVLPGVGH